MKIRLDFCDFGPNFLKTRNTLWNLLSQHFDLELASRPDFLFYSHDGHVHRMHDGIKIFYTCEPIRPDFAQCDFALTCFHIDDPRHLRFPHYLWDHRGEELIRAADETPAFKSRKTKFCAFVVSSRRPARRTDFFQHLSRYKRVDSGGRILNNIGGPIPGSFAGKHEFLLSYKFNLAFENAAVEGYTTEKLVEAMRARCVPIYWGNPRVGEEFNPRSFINAADFPNDDALVEHIRKVDTNDTLWEQYLAEPYFHDNRPNAWFDHQRIVEFFDRVFRTREQPVSQRRGFSFARWMLVRRNRRHPWPPV